MENQTEQSVQASEVAPSEVLAPEAEQSQETKLEPVVEPKKEEKAEPEKKDLFSSKFAALSRKERQIKQAEQEFKAQQEAFQKEMESLKAKYSKYESYEERLKKDPFSILAEHGLTYEQLTEMALNDGKPTAEMKVSEAEKKMMSKLEELQKRLDEKEQKELERQKQLEEENLHFQVESFVSNIEQVVTSNKDRYEAINLYPDTIQDVFDLITERHNKDQTILSIEEAADLVEEALVQEAQRVMNLKKLAKKSEKIEDPIKPVVQNKQTLSNDYVSAQSDQDQLSEYNEYDLIRKAASVLKWNND